MLGIAAVPYLREGDVRLSGVSDSETDRRRAWENGVRAHYEAVHQKLVEWVGPEVPLVAMGHLFVAGSSVGGAAESVSALSDEADASVYVGSLRNVSAAAFGEGWRYIALGHIHRPQAAAGSNGTAWYCGSPLMLDFGAISDKQQILEVVITDHGVEKHAIHVPQPRILTRISGTLEALQLRLLEVGREAPGAVVEVFLRARQRMRTRSCKHFSARLNMPACIWLPCASALRKVSEAGTCPKGGSMTLRPKKFSGRF